VYAFCRWADDLCDEIGDPARSVQLLDWWRSELDACYQDRPGHPVFVALHRTVRQMDLPRAPFDDLIDAFLQTQRVTPSDTYEQLLGYCDKSANPVGRLVLYLGGYRDVERQALSDRICTALQLTNFWQDVSRDLEIPRVYIPQEDMESCGYSNEELKARLVSPAFRSLMEMEVERTRKLFIEGMPLARSLQGPLRFDVELFPRVGLALLSTVERQGFDTLSQRPRLSRFEKIRLTTTWLFRRCFSRPFSSTA